MLGISRAIKQLLHDPKAEHGPKCFAFWPFLSTFGSLKVRIDGMGKFEHPGSCHCGNVTYRVESRYALNELPLRSCTCSFCRRHGPIYTSDPEGCLHVDVKDASEVRVYEFATKAVQFVICQTCGVMPLALARIDNALYAVVAVNCLQELPPGVPSAVNFSDESPDAGKQRRKSNWINKVILDGWPDNPFEPTSRTVHSPSSVK